jgi:hypothetical protein
MYTALHCAAGGAGGGTTYEALQGADALWSKLRNAKVLTPLSEVMNPVKSK